MKNDVFITGTSCYFPNKPVSNEDMEDFLGLITGKHSRVKPVILKQNGIKQRYYALTKEQKITHTNAEMAVNSILQLLKNSDISNSEIELLSCATSSPDQMLPSHASMVHGLLKNKPLEIFCKRLLNYILCIRFFIEVHSIVSASRFFHMPTYLRVVIECQSRFFPFFPAFSRNCPDYFLHTSGSSSFRSLSDLGAR